ncbi:MAG: hypothetical protein ABFD53_03170, partial [Anaerolineaceae bacterium]
FAPIDKQRQAHENFSQALIRRKVIIFFACWVILSGIGAIRQAKIIDIHKVHYRSITDSFIIPALAA